MVVLLCVIAVLLVVYLGTLSIISDTFSEVRKGVAQGIEAAGEKKP